jgi:hypothetical protein
MWVTQVFQDSGHESPVEAARVFGSHVGCERTSLSCGVHTLTIDIEDIYFLIGLSRRGSRVSLTGSRGGGEPMDYYVRHHCVPGTEKHSGKVAIRDVWDLPLQTILYTITHMAGSAAPHMDLQIHFQYAIECMEPRLQLV